MIEKAIPEAVLVALRAAVGPKGTVETEDEKAGYLIDERRLYKGESPIVLRPKTTAEVAVAFAGFISIFLVLATRDGRFQAVDAWSIRLIVICSVAPVFYATAPLVLNSLGMSGAMLWRISSSAIGLSGVVIAPYMARQMRALPPGEGRSLNVMFWLGMVANPWLSCEYTGLALGAFWRFNKQTTG